MAARLHETWYKWTVENWEEDVLTRHKMTSGTMLVLGAGVGASLSRERSEAFSS